ncbi:MAG: hypothetical protein HKN45_03855 [Flavobacteriales bacterium]|nr:hypothetical protein [Flavobacteriales bacterium]NNK81355.1 hypothetical protein [Flavobacteriales bacterium]
MSFVTKRPDIIKNLEKFETYLNSKKKDEKDFAIAETLEEDLIMIYKVDGENKFLPARFVAYKGNDVKAYAKIKDEENKDVEKVMTKVVGLPFSNQGTIDKFSVYIKSLSKKKFSTDRTFWRLKDERGKNFNLVTKK